MTCNESLYDVLLTIFDCLFALVLVFLSSCHFQSPRYETGWESFVILSDVARVYCLNTPYLLMRQNQNGGDVYWNKIKSKYKRTKEDGGSQAGASPSLEFTQAAECAIIKGCAGLACSAPTQCDVHH